jgi:hypothetical protein
MKRSVRINAEVVLAGLAQGFQVLTKPTTQEVFEIQLQAIDCLAGRTPRARMFQKRFAQGLHGSAIKT